MKISIDVETFSECDLKRSGSSAYSRHKSTEVLIFCYAFDDGPVNTWLPSDEVLPKNLHEAIHNSECEFHAWNASFEQNILANVLDIHVPLHRWRCTMIKALGCSLPGSLSDCGKALLIAQDKAKSDEGKKLIQKFSKVTRDKRSHPLQHPDDFRNFIEYCKQDVIAEREISSRLPDLSKQEWSFWISDRRTNRNGLSINRALVVNAIQLLERATTRLISKMSEATELKNPKSPKQMKEWLLSKGHACTTLDKNAVKKLLSKELDSDVREVLEMYQKTSKSSTSKFIAILDGLDGDDRLRECFQMYGASRTGRDAGRRFQPQNLPRATCDSIDLARHLVIDQAAYFTAFYPDVHETLSSLVRSTIEAPPGKKLVVADLNAIEIRVWAWMTGCERMNTAFEVNEDPYIELASVLFEVDKNDVTKLQRTNAKPVLLGSAYGLGPGKKVMEDGEERYTGLLGYAKSMGVDINEDDCKVHADTFKALYPEVREFGYKLQDTLIEVIKTSSSKTLKWGMTAAIENDFMVIRLPSGRPLRYHKPAILKQKTPWGAIKDTISYMGFNSSRKWCRLTTHWGKLIENLTQAISRDVLYYNLINDMELIAKVHDEVVYIADRDDKKALDRVITAMSKPIDWAPGLLLSAEGYESLYYRKD